MKVVRVPGIVIPNEAVLYELAMAVRRRQAEVRADLEVETLQKFRNQLTKKLEALEFLVRQIQQVQSQTGPLIDVVMEDLAPDSNQEGTIKQLTETPASTPQSDNPQNQPQL